MKPVLLDNNIFSSILCQALEDIKDYFNYSKPEHITILASTSKKSPTCPLLNIEKWHPSNVNGAFDLFLTDQNIYISETEYWNLKDCVSNYYKTDMPPSTLLKHLLKQEGLPLCFPLFHINVDVRCYKKRKPYSVKEKLVDQEVISQLIKETIQSSITWHFCSRHLIKAFPEHISQKESLDSTTECFYGYSEDREKHYIAVVIEKDCIYDINFPVIKAKKYRQYFLIQYDKSPICNYPIDNLSSENPTYKLVTSAGSLLKFIFNYL